MNIIDALKFLCSGELLPCGYCIECDDIELREVFKVVLKYIENLEVKNG